VVPAKPPPAIGLGYLRPAAMRQVRS